MYKLLSLVLVIACYSCTSDETKPNKRSVDTDGSKEVIAILMQEQEDAWNNGDLNGFMKHYWKSDSLIFVGKSGLNRGWQQTLDNYKTSYPNKMAMGQLNFTNRYFDTLSDSSTFVIGKWELFRSSDTLSGHYSLLWKKLNGNWKIVVDHSS